MPRSAKPWAYGALIAVLLLLGYQMQRLFTMLPGTTGLRSPGTAANTTSQPRRSVAAPKPGSLRSLPPPPLEAAKDSAFKWVSLTPEPVAGALAGSQPGFEAIGGNFDRDPDDELLLLTSRGERHWLVEADGSRRELAFAHDALSGSQALDVDGDGVDELIPGLAAGAEPARLLSACDLTGRVVRTLPPWAEMGSSSSPRTSMASRAWS
jgi:hypothetical protein